MNRMIAVLGLGKTAEGDFLSSEDVQLLEDAGRIHRHRHAECAPVRSLESKAAQYERLKEFNENIVESISVGVLAVDLEDRIESWNSQMEVMYALPRAEVLGRPLTRGLPAGIPRGVLPRAPEPGHSQPLQVPAGHHRGRHARHQHRHRAAGQQGLQRHRPPDHRGRHHRAHRTGIATLAGGEAVVHRTAGRGRGARSQHSAGGDLVVRADAGQAGAAATRRSRSCWTRSRGRPSAPRRSSTAC